MGICKVKNPEEIYKVLLESGNAMADAEYTYRVLNDSTKSVLAQLSLGAKNSQGCSVAEANLIALTSSVYSDHLLATAEAARISERAKIRYYSSKTLSDLYRSQEASERAAMGRAT